MTDRIVVDTNVLVVANGNNEQADPECELACIELLQEATKGKQTVLLDTSDLIMAEYRKNCSHRENPTLGISFYKFLNDYQHSTKNVIHVYQSKRRQTKTVDSRIFLPMISTGMTGSFWPSQRPETGES